LATLPGVHRLEGAAADYFDDVVATGCT